MKSTQIGVVIIVSLAVGSVAREASGADRKFYGDPPDDTHAWCVHDTNRPLPPVVKPGDAPGQPPADAIMANPGSITGSIGVIVESLNVEELLKKIGLRSNVIKSGKHKDMGSPMRPMTEEDRLLLQGADSQARTLGGGLAK